MIRSSDGFYAGVHDPFDAPLQLSRIKAALIAFQCDGDGDFSCNSRGPAGVVAAFTELGNCIGVLAR
jgi:hypothetical protein